MKIFVTTLSLSLAVMLGGKTQAAMSITPFILSAQLSDGTVMNSGTAVIIGDLDDSFDPSVPLSADTFDEEVVGVAGIGADDGQQPGHTFPVASNLINGNEFVAEVTPFWVLLFNSSFDPLVEGPGPGVEYGIFPLGTFPDNTSNGPQFFGPPESFNTTIPEPASLALLGLGGLLIARRRRA